MVVGDAAQKAGDEAAAHDGPVARHGAHEAHGDAAALLAHAEALKVVVGHEVVVDGLVEAAGAQDLAHLALKALLEREAAHVVARSRQGGLDAALAPQTHDLLVQVDLAGEVGAERRGHDVEHVGLVGIGHLAAQTHEGVLGELVGDRGAHHGTQALTAQLELDGGLGGRVAVHGTARHAAATHLGEQRRGDVGDPSAPLGVDDALVAHGSLGEELQVAARARSVAVAERGALEQDVDGGVVDLGVLAAHDAGKGDGGLAVVGDERHVGGELALLAVERGELLAVVGGAHDDVGAAVGVARELAQVEGVQGLAGEVHHVVRDVDHVVDGTRAGGDDALGKPLGAGGDLHAGDDAGDIAGAQLGIVDLHVDQGVDVAVVLDKLGQLDVGVAVQHRTGLAGHADHRQAVGAVGRDLAVDHDVGLAGVLAQGHAHGGVGRKDPDAVVVRTHAQLALGAVHAAGLHAAQLALLDLDVTGQLGADHGNDDVVALVEVLSAAHDLQWHRVALPVDIGSTHAHLGDPHVVRIRMGLLLEHHAGHDVVEALAHLVDGLDLGTRAGVFLYKLGHVVGNVDHSLEPFI